MRILLKCPTRSRPQRVLATLTKYMQLANHPEQIGVAISCDIDDTSMQKNLVQEEIHRVLRPCEWRNIYFSENRSKIQACNADMDRIEYNWDIVVLVSDDMVPCIKGYDDAIRNYMTARYPDTNGILWFDDGHQGYNLNPLCVFGRKMYEEFGYIYHPSYKSLFCDTELTDLCKGSLKDRTTYIPYCIIRHEHPGTGYKQYMDALYDKNQKYWNEDMYNYINRKSYSFQVSFLIPTIAGRESSLKNLMASIREKMARIAPDIKYEITVDFDNREVSIGMKRQRLLESAQGKYMAFVDDDDNITDEYVQDLKATIQGSYHVMRLRGQICQYTFTHSLENKLEGVMAKGDVFLRPPNHLNPMMTDVAKIIRFGDAVRGEDLEWTIRMAKAGFLSREYSTDDSRIHYIYDMGTRTVDAHTITFQQQTSYETMLRMIWTPKGAMTPEAYRETEKRETGPQLRLGPRGFVSK